uniref:Cell division cycle 5-like protein n=1 Tax=Rhizochromulina marina TaxID=1034831 RepID=A0A7S2SCC5_9STRA
MVRIMIKGGVWKNTEDEILKAAVMKYGKNQWSRVASLLNRKSAKQCKARWYEWLDPSIKKTEWTREEEEKLLHLAKLYPSQWRTIAPIVGRTAAQCMERYEALLDSAQAAAGEMEASAQDARRLRPGEIDPHPETKPARPDPIDMDEDEKEMLAEARARLANTRGKKAKRKAREKQLEEAKRLANLQKRRELKAAGVERKLGRRKRKYIDYGEEIPFQRVAPSGFYDVEDERQRTKKMSIEAAGRDFEVQRLESMENKRREKEEAEERKKDRKKLRKMEEANPAQIMAQISKANDPLSYRRRTELDLPAPQVTDQELEQVLKVGALALPEAAGGAGDPATQALVGDYTQRSVLPTPMRTPRTAAGGDVILQEARNQLAMLNSKTPLLGGDNPNLEGGTGFEGVTPKSSKMTTPNVLPTPGATPLLTNGTPARSTGSATPLRDELGVNEDNLAGGAPGMSEAARLRHQRAQLQMSLSNLPEPQYQYEIEVPDVKPDEAEAKQAMEEDAADRDARDEAARRAAEEAEFQRRSAAVRRELPRPKDVASSLSQSRKVDTALEQADAEVRLEMATLVGHDAARFPYNKPGAKKEKKRKRNMPVLESFSDEELAAARGLVAAELATVAVERGGPVAPEQFANMWSAVHGEIAYLPSRKAYGTLKTASANERLESLSAEFEAVRQHMANTAEKCAKLEKKLALKTQGYQDRAQGLLRETASSYQVLDKRRVELLCFQMLEANEDKALPQRLQALQSALSVEQGRNASLQSEYASLIQERDALYARLMERQQKDGASSAESPVAGEPIAAQ